MQICENEDKTDMFFAYSSSPAPPSPTHNLRLSWAFPSRAMALKKSHTKRSPVKFPSGILLYQLKFSQLAFTAVSWDNQLKMPRIPKKSAEYCYTATLENGAKQ